MAKYRVWAECISDVYLDVEADTPQEAWDIAYATDGGDFIDAGAYSGDWKMCSVDSVEELSDED